MKSQRKAERDRAKRDAARHSFRSVTGDTAGGADETLDELDLQIARSVQGYDE